MGGKYWEAGPSLIYMSYAGISHDCLRKYGDRVIQYIICADIHKVKNHRYRLTN